MINSSPLNGRTLNKHALVPEQLQAPALVTSSQALAQVLVSVPLLAPPLVSEGQTAAWLTVAVPIRGGLELRSQVELAPLGFSFPLAGVSSQNSLITGALGVPMGLAGTVSQSSELVGEFADPDSLGGLSLQQTRVSSPMLLFAGEVAGLSQQDSGVSGTLNLSTRWRGASSQGSLCQGRLQLAISLSALPSSQASLVRATLSNPALNSTGWLTVTDIVLHNDLQALGNMERLRASAITLLPALSVEKLELKPEH